MSEYIVSVVVRGDDYTLYRHMMSMSKIIILDNGKMKLPQRCNTKEFYETLSGDDWNNLPELPDDIRSQLNL